MGMAGLTDQFPISPSHPAVIRSSSTWREAWIPLGFISSNYPLLPPHAVLSSPILYFPPGSWHCPLLPVLFIPLPFGSVVLHLRSLSVCWELFLTCVESIYRDINVFNANYTRIHTWMCTFLPLFALRLLFFAECTDKLDICSLFQIVFHTDVGISMRTTEKAKILPGAAFYFQFVFICPSAPHGCLWERVSTCFIGRYCVSGSKSVFTHRCESRTSVSVPLLFVSGWNYLGVNGFVCLPLYM